jgi:hypothetical protein
MSGQEEEEAEAYQPYYEEERAARRSQGVVYAQKHSSSGCAQATLYIVIGSLLALVIVLLFFGQTINNVSDIFGLPNFANRPTPVARTSPAAITMRVQQMNRLETTSYTIEKVIEVSVEGDYLIEDNPVEDWLFGERMLLIAHGRVIAGIDLSELSEDDIVVSSDGMSLTMQLPPARILDVSLDNEQTRVYDREQGLLAPQNINLEAFARQQGEDAILQTACEDGIMQRANEEAQQSMEQFLSLLDFEEVEVVMSEPGPCLPAE